MNEKITPYDFSEILDSQEDIELFLNDVFLSGHSGYIMSALGVVCKVKGKEKKQTVAKDKGVTIEQLQRILSENENPSFETVLKVIESLGLGISIRHLEH